MTEIQEAVQAFERMTGSGICTTHDRVALDALRRTAEYDKLQDEGRLVVLPQDGMLYHIEEIAETGEKWVGNKPIQKITFTCGFGLVGVPFEFSQIGKTVFLTREEAETALGGTPDERP